MAALRQDPPLLERSAEVEAIERAVRRAVAGSGNAVVVEGPAGIGKTRLLGAIKDRGEHAGMRVLSARGRELEQDFGWSGVRQLFEPVLVDAEPDWRAQLLCGAAALAAPTLPAVATPGEPEPPGDPDLFSALHGLYWLTANLSREAPLVLAVDDVHWVDLPSLRYLAYTVPRLEGLPVLIAATVRPGDRAEELEEALAGLAAEPLTSVLRPAPLTSRATDRLLQIELGERPGEDFSQACYELTRGNPFLLRELIREIAAARLAQLPDATEHIRRISPQVLSRSALRRLASFSTAALGVARAVAVLGHRAEPGRTAAIAAIERAEAIDAAAGLVAAELLRGGDPLLEFVHPLVRAAVYSDIPDLDRARLHGAAAELLEREGLPPAEAATHLLLASPSGSAAAVDTLRAAAADARALGIPETAVRYLRRALSEPPAEAEARADVLFELGVAEASGDPAAALGHLAEARQLVHDQPRRAQISLALAQVMALAGRFVDAAEVLGDAVNEMGADHSALATQLESTRIAVCRWDLALQPTRAALLERLRHRAAAVERLHPPLHANLAIEETAAGERREVAVHHARLALAQPDALAAAAPHSLAEAISVLIFADLADEAAQTADAALAAARRRGSQIGAAYAASVAGIAALRRGAVGDALAYSRESVDASSERWIPPVGVAFLVEALMERGELAAARHELAQHGFDGDLPADWPSTVVRYVRARLAAASGDHRVAAQELIASGEFAEGVGVRNPGLMEWRSSASRSLAALRCHAEAQELAETELARARRWGAHRALGVALAAAGIADPGERGMALLRDAVGMLERAPAALELARARVDLGTQLRQHGRRVEAREQLRRGLDLAHHCGGVLLADRARSELVLAGAKPRRDALRGRDALTGAELRVARLAAAGATNREIAQWLFVTLRTVEHHLSSTYAKLAIRSRHELADALDAPARAKQ